jgi:ATP-dependent exoDNAse (exonuclease V) alpha subunit
VFVHRHYKAQQIERARLRGGYRNIPPPRGEQQIIYGDKVINNRNWAVPKNRIYPKTGERGYLANGEIGMVVGHRRMRARNWEPENLEIEFSTQQGTVFTFYKSDFSDEKESGLELAYALTVHKAQGSEFEVVFLVLPRSPLMITRELLYTALTRQKQKVVILHQGSATDLQRLSSERYSATATRLTNLFGPPRPVAVGGAFLEERLIHRTTRGDAVRSKS